MSKYAFYRWTRKNLPQLDCGRSIHAIHGGWNDSRRGSTESGIVLSPIPLLVAGIDIPHQGVVDSNNMYPRYLLLAPNYTYNQGGEPTLVSVAVVLARSILILGGLSATHNDQITAASRWMIFWYHIARLKQSISYRDPSHLCFLVTTTQILCILHQCTAFSKYQKDIKICFC